VFELRPNEAVRSSLCGAFGMLILWLTSNINVKWLTPFVAQQHMNRLAPPCASKC